MKSFREGIKAGEIRRADAMKVRLCDIHEEPGFNLRREGEDLQQSIDELAAFIAQGGQLPPLEVRPRDAGGVWLVDGHRRVRAYRQMGAEVQDADGEVWLNVVAFVGNDADRVARVITSQEGRKLAPLEIAGGYKRLTAFGWAPDQIAAKVGKTRQHVDQMLVLANANSDVQKLVADGAVAAATAVQVVRKEGENAGNVLGEQLSQARANGKAKVTAGTIAGPKVPAKVLQSVAEELDVFFSELPTSTKLALKTAKTCADLIEVPAGLLNSLLMEHAAYTEALQTAQAKFREKAAKAAQGELEA